MCFNFSSAARNSDRYCDSYPTTIAVLKAICFSRMTCLAYNATRVFKRSSRCCSRGLYSFFWSLFRRIRPPPHETIVRVRQSPLRDTYYFETHLLYVYALPPPIGPLDNTFSFATLRAINLYSTLCVCVCVCVYRERGRGIVKQYAPHTSYFIFTTALTFFALSPRKRVTRTRIKRNFFFIER